MEEQLGRIAIDRAIRSLRPGGSMDLGFFGGEPLVVSDLVARLADHARAQCARADVQLALTLTTNGAVHTREAWNLMLSPDLDLAVSCDGLPRIHDRHRCTATGEPTSATVKCTLMRLLDAGRSVRVVMVVRPDTLDSLPAGVAYLRDLGVTRVEPSLDLWTRWSPPDLCRLQEVIVQLADLWREGLPGCGIGWLDEKAALLAGVPIECGTRCRFGAGDLAVAPSGRLYPCERLIGSDDPRGPMVLPGHVLDCGNDFVFENNPPGPARQTCAGCAVVDHCNTFCRCGNYTRTGNVNEPDRLLCMWNQACMTQAARVMSVSG
jgi:uncharacterized protein